MLNRKFLLIVFIFASILLGFKGYFFYKNIEEEKALTLILQEESKKEKKLEKKF